MNPNTIATSIRSTRAQNIANKYGVIDINAEDHPFWAKLLNGKSFGDVYQLGMSMADSAAVLAMSPILGSYGTVLLGGSAGTQGVINALENGATDEQALAMGVLNGFFEMFFEKFSLETLLSSNGRRFIDALWRQAVAEGSEELFTSAANNVADIIVMAEKSGYMKNVSDYIDDGLSESEAMQKALLDMGIDMGWDFVGGLITGGIMGGGGKVATNSVQQLRNYKTGINIQSTDGGVDALLNSANQVRNVSSAQMQNALTSQIDKVTQNPTARNIGQLYTTVQAANNQAKASIGQFNATTQAATNQTNTSINQVDVAKSLKGKGIPTQKIDSLAGAIVARVNGRQLTETQRSILSFELGRPAVQNVISELLKKKADGIDSAQNRMYDEGNLSSLKNREETALRDSSSLEVLSTAQQRGVTSETAALGDTSVAEDSPIHQERNALPKRRSRGGKDAKKPYATSRPSYGKGQIEQVWENAKDPITGKVFDPSGVEITWDPTKPRNGQWDMGHMPEAKYSKMHQLYMDDVISLEEFLEWYRNPANYRPELPSTNRSHKYE